MKIWYQSGLVMEDCPHYAASLEAGFARAKADGTEVVLRGRGNAAGPLSNHDVISSPAAYFAIYSKVFVNAVLEAEASGADVFVIGTLSEPIPTELKCIARIPVISTFEAAMLLACSVAPKFGVVTVSRTTADPFIGKAVKTHGLEARFSNYEIVDPQLTEDELHERFNEPGPYVERFAEAARRSIAAGAHAIIPGEGMLAAMVSQAGLFEIDGAPVVDVVAASIHFAELAVRLNRAQGWLHSRVAYPLPSEAARNHLFPARVDHGGRGRD